MLFALGLNGETSGTDEGGDNLLKWVAREEIRTK